MFMDPFFMSAICTGTGALISQKNEELKRLQRYYDEQPRIIQEDSNYLIQLSQQIEDLKEQLKKESEELKYQLEIKKRRDILEKSIAFSTDTILNNAKIVTILKERLIKGEISKEQYYRLKEIIESG